jgi:Tol biopolymer transport system component
MRRIHRSGQGLLGAGLGLVVAAALVVTACSEGAESPLAVQEDSSFSPPAGVVVSDPQAIAASAVADGASAGTDFGFVYVSARPDTWPGATGVRIRNLASGAGPTPMIPVQDGGFDPVAVPARPGDRLELAILRDDGETHVVYLSVPSGRPPTVVRTNPRRGRRDVALSVQPVVVFTEAIDPETLTPSSVRLLQDGTPVAGAVALVPGSPFMAQFVPDALLEPGTDYELVIATSILDLDGDALEEEYRAHFRTADEDDAQPTVALAFVSTRDGAQHIYVANADGSRVTRVAEGSWPALSWDGARIALVRPASSAGPTGIYVVNSDGSDLKYVGPGVLPTWSPDGRIAFIRNPSYPPGFGLYVMNADGSGVTGLLSRSWLCGFSADCNQSHQILHPTWSPDGRSIAFQAYMGGDNKTVGIVNADGSDPRLLRELLELGEGAYSRGVNTRAAWSPDGSTIAVITGNSWLFSTFPYLIYRYDIASGGLEVVHTAPGMGVGSAANHPEWTPDGSHLVFDASSEEGDPRAVRRIFTVSVETGEVRQLIPEDPNRSGIAHYSDFGAVWSRAQLSSPGGS